METHRWGVGNLKQEVILTDLDLKMFEEQIQVMKGIYKIFKEVHRDALEQIDFIEELEDGSCVFHTANYYLTPR